MSEILFQYERIAPTTWAYLASLLMIGVYFKFGRFWSMRNLDLVLLILLSPGLLSIHYGREMRYAAERAQAEALAPVSPGVEERDPVKPLATVETMSFPHLDDFRADRYFTVAHLSASYFESRAAEGGDAAFMGPQVGWLTVHRPPIDEQAPDTSSLQSELERQIERGRSIERIGFLWMFCISGVLLLRLLTDPTMVRRPLLEPNLASGGLTFIGCSLFVFLMANVITSKPTDDDLQGPRGAEQMVMRKPVEKNDDSLNRYGPGLHLIHVLPTIPTVALDSSASRGAQHSDYALIAKGMAILGHLAVVIGIVAIGYRHFGNFKTGVGCATIYLMLPYTSMMTGRVVHVLPAALLVWAVLCYRRPLTAGLLIGLAIGAVYFPIFLLPLWISFYWQRGLARFLIGVVGMLAFVTLSLTLVADDFTAFVALFQKMFGLWAPKMKGLEGLWELGWQPAYRIPVIVACLVLSIGLALWPAQKNLGTLISCSAAMMVAVQFCHGFGGGLFVGWYLPLLLLTVFRPNLEDRVALAVLSESWLRNGRQRLSGVRAASIGLSL